MDEYMIDRSKSVNDLVLVVAGSGYDSYKALYDGCIANAAPLWIEKGKSLVYPEKVLEWENLFQPESLNRLNGGYVIEQSLEVMETLANFDNIGEAISVMMLQKHTMLSLALVRKIVLKFSKKGPEFYEATAFGNLTPEEMAEIAKNKQENEALAQLHSEVNR